MKFNPKFSSLRSRLVVLAIVLCINAFVVHDRPMVILAAAAVLAAILPESRGKKPEPAQYAVMGMKEMK